MSTSDSHSTHIPGSPTAGGASSGSFAGATSFPPEDLSNDGVIRRASRIDYQGRHWPTLGGIPLVARLGEGGMGAVYYGFHVRLDQEVAVKVLPFQRAAQHPHLIQRFYREARMAAKVRSPRLVGVLDINEENGLYYLVMEFVKGVTAGGALKRMLNAGLKGLNESDALDLCIAASEGVAAAHTQGIIHRDIKPDNILVPEDPPGSGPRYNQAKLADLGLARGDTHTTALTGSNAMMGSPGFLAPEQAMDAHTAGKRSDIFSMGATLYALLAGQPPFMGANALAAAYASVRTPHRPVRELRPDVSLATAALIDRCLNKKAEERYADGTALLQGLRLCRQQLGLGEALQNSTIEQLTILVNKAEVGQPYQFVSDSEEMEQGVQPLTPNPPKQQVAPPTIPQTHGQTPYPPTIPQPVPQGHGQAQGQTPYPQTQPQAPQTVPHTYQQAQQNAQYAQYASPLPGSTPFRTPVPPGPQPSGSRNLITIVVLMGMGAAALLVVVIGIVLVASGKLKEWTQNNPVPVVPQPSPSPYPVPYPVPAPAPVPVPVPVPRPPDNDPFEAGLRNCQALLDKGDFDGALNGFKALKLNRPNDPRVLDGLNKTAQGLLNLGDAALAGNQKDFPLAVNLYAQAAAAYRETPDTAGLFTALLRQGLNTQPHLNAQGDWTRAVSLFNECLKLAQDNRLESQEGEAWYQLGFAYMPGMHPQGDWKTAIDDYMKALRMATRARHKVLESNTYHALGYCNEANRNPQGNWQSAAMYYAQCAKGREALGDKAGAAQVLTNQGMCLSTQFNERGSADQALRCFENALKLAQEANSDLEQARALLNQGVNLQPNFNQRGNWSLAQSLHRKAQDKFESAKDRGGVANAIYDQGVCMVMNNKINMTNQARSMFQRAADIYEEINDSQMLTQARWWLQ